MKKGIMLILALLLTACTVTPKETEAVEPLVDAKELAELTLESAQEKYGELKDRGPYEVDGLKGHIYGTQDYEMEFVFVDDGQKLRSAFFYPEDLTIESVNDALNALAIERNPDIELSGNRFRNPDDDGLIREIAFTGDSPKIPMKVSILQIWFK